MVRPVTPRWARVLAPPLLAGLALWPAASRAQVAEVNVRNTLFHEPSSKGSQMTVINPALSLSVMPADWLTVTGRYEADIVSGASEPVKAGPLSTPDIISQASVKDLRHIAGGGFTLTRKNTRLSAGYTYGREEDYRSHGFSVSTGTDFFQRNTQIDLAYARGFDQVCNVAYPESRDPTLRQSLDTADGCFTSSASRQALDIDINNFQASWTQAWTPVFTTQLTTTFQLINGFQGNPYRGVVIGPTGQIAQEHHPENRARTAAAIRLKYYVRELRTAFGLSGRGYRDTWDILGQTYQLDAERHMSSWLRVLIRGRLYSQTGALFWSDDYTGGEPFYGPRGQYWSGDRELSPLKSAMIGGRVLGHWQGSKGARDLGMFLSSSASASVDLVNTFLEDFTLAGEKPDDTFALVLGINFNGTF